MARKYFNWKLALVLVIGFIVVIAAAFVLHRWQRSHRAERALPLGLKTYDERKWDDAAANFGRYLSVNPDDVSVLLKYANAQLKKRPTKVGSIQQAIAAYRSVLRLDPNNTEATEQLAKLYLSYANPSEAELILRKYLENNKNTTIRTLLAQALVRQRKFQEAHDELTAIVKDNPDHVLAYEILGLLAEQRPKDFSEQPAFWFDEVVKKNPTSALAYAARAAFYIRTSQLPKALADLEQAEKQDLSDPAVHLRIAGEFIGANALDKAREHLKAVKQKTPTDLLLWQTWADLAIRSGSKQEIQNVAETALKELGADSDEFLLVAAELWLRAGQPDQAAQCVAKMREKDSYPPIAAFIEGLIFEYKGQFTDAIKAWNEAIKLGYKDEHGHPHPRARLKLASVYSRLADKQSAIVQLRGLVSDDPAIFEGHLALARLLASYRDWPEAAEQARQARELAPAMTEAALAMTEAALLELQARIQIIATGQAQTETTPATWTGINKQLSDLDKSTNGAIEVKFLQIQAALLQKKLADAQTLATQLKAKYPSDLRVAMIEFELLIAQNKEDQAIELLTQVAQQFPQEVEPVRNLALLLNRRNERGKCETVLKDALTRLNQPDAKRDLSILLVELYAYWNQRDKEYDLLSRLSQELPDNVLIKRRLLATEQTAKNTPEAQKLVDQIKSLEGQAGWQWRYEQAKVWLNSSDFKNRYTQVISLLQENLLANPEDQASRVLLAAAYEHNGELQLAISTYREALSRSPGNVLIIIPLVSTLYKAQDFDQAEELLNRAAQQGLSHPDLQKLQLQTYLRRGELGSASEILEGFVSTDPNNASASLALALLLIKQSKFVEAQAILDKLRIQQPDSLSVVVALVQLNISQNKPEEALRLCSEVAAKLNNAFSYVLRARTYAAVGQLDKALEDFAHAAKIEPNNVEIWVARSGFYRVQGRLNEATADIEHALSLSPKDIRVQKLAILTFMTSADSNGMRRAVALLDESLKANPQDLDLRLYKARSLLYDGTAPAVESAQSILQAVTDTNPAVVDAWVLLAETQLQQGNPGKAIDTTLRGLSQNPNDKQLLLLKARVEAINSPNLAVLPLRLLAEQDPNDVDVAVRLAVAYVAAGDPQKAIDLLKNQLRTCPDSARRRCEIALAAALYVANKKVDAEALFNKLNQAEPNDPVPLLTQAQLLSNDKLWDELTRKVADWSRKHPDDTRTPMTIATVLGATQQTEARQIAESIFRAILDRNPKFNAAALSLATLLQTAGRPAEAAQYYQRVLDSEPNNFVVINNLAWILCEEQSEPRKALELIERGIRVAPPQYIDIMDTRGIIYFRLGEYEKALRDFTQSLKLYPANVPSAVATRFHLARALNQLKRTSEAREQLQQVLDLNNRIGGLSQTDLTEARRLLEQLQKGS